MAGERRRCAHFPLGGIGTGNVSLSADGSLRQWQLVNAVDHKAHVPSSFFFMHWARPGGPAGTFSVLEARVDTLEGFAPAPAVNDHLVPADVRDRQAMLPLVDDTIMDGTYPIARLAYVHAASPVEVSVEACTPMIPLDVKRSGMPVAIFTFTARNTSPDPVVATIGCTLLNFVGWNGTTRINTTFFPAFLANVNDAVPVPGGKALHCTSRNPVIDPACKGDVVLAVLHDAAIVIPSIGSTGELAELLDDPGLASSPMPPTEPSEPGKTWLGAAATRVTLAAGAADTVTVLLAWHFPGRFVNYDRGLHERVLPPGEAKTDFFLGNRYATWFPDALAVAKATIDELAVLLDGTRAFRDALFATTLLPEIVFSVSTTMSFLRSPSCFITATGEFHGFEGCCGESTGGGKGGCCPMDCTHVWNYVMAVARLYPTLELSIRETEFGRVSDDGCLPHRIVLPSHLPQAWTVAIGGPTFPALDGLLGCVLKTWREYSTTGDRAWLLGHAMPAVKRMLGHVFEFHDEHARGWIDGPQGNTYDIEFHGKNTYIGLLYLAALRVGAMMASIAGDGKLESDCMARHERGVTAYGDAWNGEYWEQLYDEARVARNQYGRGCLSDQLFGQWWADVLGLGDILEPERIDRALDSIVRYNLQDSFTGFVQKPRVYVKNDETALHVCTWPRGGKPEHPVMYGDEAGWTGLEYELAGLLVKRGKWDQAARLLRGVQARYDGRCRNPWNEVECGDHYVRAMSSWAVLELASGFRWDAPSGTISITPPPGSGPFTSFFITGTGWGTFTLGGSSLDIQVVHGQIAVDRLVLTFLDPAASVADPVVSVGDARLPGIAVERGDGNELRLSFEPRLVLEAGPRLTVRVR